MLYKGYSCLFKYDVIKALTTFFANITFSIVSGNVNI